MTPGQRRQAIALRRRARQHAPQLARVNLLTVSKTHTILAIMTDHALQRAAIRGVGFFDVMATIWLGLPSKRRRGDQTIALPFRNLWVIVSDDFGSGDPDILKRANLSDADQAEAAELRQQARNNGERVEIYIVVTVFPVP